MRTTWYAALALLLMPYAAYSQSTVPLEITHRGDDAGGRTVVEALREAVRTLDGRVKSPEQLETSEAHGMRLTTQLARPRIRLQLVSSALDTSHTVFAVTVVYDSPDMPLGGAYIRSMVEACRADEPQPCAQRILVRANGAIEWLRLNWPSLWRTLAS